MEGAELTSYERRVVDDFVSRRKLPTPVGLGVGLAGLAMLLLAPLPPWVAVVTGALCGGLLGAWIEKRHLHDLSGAVAKLTAAQPPQKTSSPM